LKILLTILLNIPLLLCGQRHFTFFPGEYLNQMVDNTTHKLYTINTTASLVGGVPDSITGGCSGAHHMLSLSSNGRVYAFGDDTNGELGDGGSGVGGLILTDSLGNPFRNVVQVSCGGTAGGWNSMALKSDGTVWAWGALDGGLRGNNTHGGQANRPVQIPFPGGTFIKQVYLSFIGLALDNTGHVWTWGGEYSFHAPYVLAQGTPTPNIYNPTQLNSSVFGGEQIKTIVGGGNNMQYAITATGKVYAWAFYAHYIAIPDGDMSVTGFNPWHIDTALNLPHPVDTMVVNDIATYAILSDSSLWAWGDCPVGNFGNGTTLDMRHYHSADGAYTPYGWDQGIDENMQLKPVNVAPGKHDFTQIFASPQLAFYIQCSDVNDRYYFAGRNKGGIACNGINGIDSVGGDLGAMYPDSWDQPYLQQIYPMGTRVNRTTCPLFKDTTGAVLQSTYPLNTSGSPPVANAGSNQTVNTTTATLKGSFTYTSPSRGMINRMWTKISGPNTPQIPIVNADTVSVLGLTKGTYVFNYAIMDNNFKTASANVTVTVTAACPNCVIRQRGKKHRFISL